MSAEALVGLGYDPHYVLDLADAEARYWAKAGQWVKSEPCTPEDREGWSRSSSMDHSIDLIPMVRFARFFVERDYKDVVHPRFKTEMPPELREMLVEERIWNRTIKDINIILDEAETYNKRIIWESLTAFLTCYCINLCRQTNYQKSLTKLRNYIHKVNVREYIPKGLRIVDPCLSGLRVIKFVVLDQELLTARWDVDMVSPKGSQILIGPRPEYPRDPPSRPSNPSTPFRLTHFKYRPERPRRAPSKTSKTQSISGNILQSGPQVVEVQVHRENFDDDEEPGSGDDIGIEQQEPDFGDDIGNDQEEPGSGDDIGDDQEEPGSGDDIGGDQPNDQEEPGSGDDMGPDEEEPGSGDDMGTDQQPDDKDERQQPVGNTEVDGSDSVFRILT